MEDRLSEYSRKRDAEFTGWTGDEKLRHSRFLGLRRDKNPSDVVLEQPA